MDVPAFEGMLGVEGLEIWYKVAGQGPVLMVQPPGWGLGGGLYEETLRQLESQLTLVYHDPRGSGRSQSPADLSEIHVGAFVEDLEALRRHLGLDRVALIGHSHGGEIAVNYAFSYPQHLSHFLLVGAPLDIARPPGELQGLLADLGEDPRLTEAAYAFARPGPLETDEDLAALLDRVLPLYFADPESPGIAAAREWVRSHRVSRAAQRAVEASDWRFPKRDRLETIRVPTLVMVGRHDFICSTAQAQTTHALIRESRLVIFEKSGHFPWIEEPDLFLSTAVEFLKGAS